MSSYSFENFPAAKAVGEWSDTPMEQAGVWVADHSYWLDEFGKLTSDKSQGVTLVVRAGMRIPAAQAKRYGLDTGEGIDGTIHAAAIVPVNDRVGDESVTGLPPKGSVIPTGHPAFAHQGKAAEQPTFDTDGNIVFGEDEDGGEDEKSDSERLHPMAPPDIQERENTMREQQEQGEGTGPAETKAVNAPTRDDKKPKVEDKAVKKPEAK